MLSGPEEHTYIQSSASLNRPEEHTTHTYTELSLCRRPSAWVTQVHCLLLENIASTRLHFNLVCEPVLPIFLAYDLELVMWKFLGCGGIRLQLPVMCTQPKWLFYHALLNGKKSNSFFPSSRTVLYSGPKLNIMITIMSDTSILVIKWKFVIENKISCHR